MFYVRTRNEPLYVSRNKTSKCISIFLSGSDNSILRESVLYTHTHTQIPQSFFIIIILPLPPSRPLHISLTSSTLFFTAIENYWNLKCRGCLRGEEWSSILLLQVPKYQWFGSGTPTYVSPFQPYTLQLSPLMCRLHTIPHFLSQKKKNLFFIRTFVFCNVPHGVSLRSNMGCYAIAYWSRVERIFFDGC